MTPRSNIRCISELTPDNHVLHELKAQGKLFKNIAIYNQAVHEFNQIIKLYNNWIFLVFMLQDKIFQAIQWATKSTELNPSYIDAWITLARAQLNFGEIGTNLTFPFYFLIFIYYP